MVPKEVAVPVKQSHQSYWCERRTDVWERVCVDRVLSMKIMEIWGHIWGNRCWGLDYSKGCGGQRYVSE